MSFERSDIFLPAAPDSVAVGDLDGQHGRDIVVGLWSPGSVGVLLNNGDATFAPLQTYTAGAECAGLAEDVTLGDVTQPRPGNRLLADGKLDAYVACTPYVTRLTGDGAGALGSPEPINLGLQGYLGSATIDMVTLMRRPDDNPVPLLVIQHAVSSFGRQLCISYEVDPRRGSRVQLHAGGGAAGRRRPQRVRGRRAAGRGPHRRGPRQAGDLRVRPGVPADLVRQLADRHRGRRVGGARRPRHRRRPRRGRGPVRQQLGPPARARSTTSS